MSREARAVGLLLMAPGGVVEKPDLRALESLGCPCAMLQPNEHVRRGAGVCAVSPDYRAIGRRQVEALAANGHARIAYVREEPWSRAGELQLEGLREAVEKAGIPPSGIVVPSERTGAWGDTGKAAYARTRQLMARRPRPTALIFDTLARPRQRYQRWGCASRSEITCCQPPTTPSRATTARASAASGRHRARSWSGQSRRSWPPRPIRGSGSTPSSICAKASRRRERDPTRAVIGMADAYKRVAQGSKSRSKPLFAQSLQCSNELDNLERRQAPPAGTGVPARESAKCALDQAQRLSTCRFKSSSRLSKAAWRAIDCSGGSAWSVSRAVRRWRSRLRSAAAFESASVILTRTR